MLVEPERLKNLVQSELDLRQADGAFLVEEVRFDDGVWMIRVVPKNGDPGAAKSAEVLSAVEEELLDAQGINTHIVRSGFCAKP